MSKHKEDKSSLLYFENPTMRGLYECLETWQNTTQKQIRYLSVQQDQGKFCCIVLTGAWDMAQSSITPYEAAMARFQRKALNHIGVAVDFLTDDIKPEKITRIQMKLEKCKTAAEVKAVFSEESSAE